MIIKYVFSSTPACLCATSMPSYPALDLSLSCCCLSALRISLAVCRTRFVDSRKYTSTRPDTPPSLLALFSLASRCFTGHRSVHIALPVHIPFNYTHVSPCYPLCSLQSLGLILLITLFYPTRS